MRTTRSSTCRLHAMMRTLFYFAMLLLAVPACLALNNGLALLPMMGWNTWNTFGCDISESLIRDTVDKLVELGLKDVGYKYVNLDDCWAQRSRLPNGRLAADEKKFPSGLKALGDYVHSKGFKFGIYSSAGKTTCAGYPASLGHELVDAETFASWGVDYLKYDNCGTKAEEQLQERYSVMRDALNATNRPIVYSLCEWGLGKPWEWAPKVGNSWRTTGDIAPYWTWMTTNLDLTVGLSRFAGPGAWNDPDMLEVGVNPEGFTVPMQRSHFALWALLKSPLIIGADLREIPTESLAILKAQELIAFNQDPLAVAGDQVWKDRHTEVFAVPLKGGARGVVLFNRYNKVANITVQWSTIGFPDDTQALVRDVYQEEDIATYSKSFTAEVGAFNCVALRITALSPWNNIDDWRPWLIQNPARIKKRGRFHTRSYRRFLPYYRKNKNNFESLVHNTILKLRASAIPF